MLRRHSSAQPRRRRDQAVFCFPEQDPRTSEQQASKQASKHRTQSTVCTRSAGERAPRPRRSAGSTDSGVRWGFGPVRASACPRRGVQACRGGCRLPTARFGHRRSVRWVPKGSRPVMAEVSLCLVCVRRATQHCATTADGVLLGTTGGGEGAAAHQLCMYSCPLPLSSHPNWSAKIKPLLRLVSRAHLMAKGIPAESARYQMATQETSQPDTAMRVGGCTSN